MSSNRAPTPSLAATLALALALPLAVTGCSKRSVEAPSGAGTGSASGTLEASGTGKSKAAKKSGKGRWGKNSKAYFEEDRPEVDVKDLGPRTIPVIDVHEHARDLAEAKRLLVAMDRFNIKRTCLQSASWYTFTLNDKYGFERFKENNETLLGIEKEYPDRFCTFVTIHPPDPGNLELLQDYARRGADGLKLYLGHGAATGKGPFHMMPLDDPRMMPIYEWAERTQFPLVFHINFIKYFDEFVRVMEAHPYLRVCVPHYGLHKNTAKRLTRLSWLFDRYPNFYSDVGFGFHKFQIEGFEAMSKWRTRSQAFLKRHASRLMYASDMVLEPTKTEKYIDETLRSYFQWLEADGFRFYHRPDGIMKGMELPPDTLKKIYLDAPSRFLLLGADGSLPDRSKDWPPTKLDGLPPTVAPVVPLAPGETPPPE